MASHYALSDVAIVLVAIWGTVALARQRLYLPSFAIACFGIAAAIGVVRFGWGLQIELAPLHANTSKILGLAAATALAIACLKPARGTDSVLIAIALPVFAGVVLVMAPRLIAPLFLLALLAALFATLLRDRRSRSGWFMAEGLAVLLVNTVIIRGASWLSEAVAWHAYHILIAVALAIVTKALLSNQVPEPHNSV